MTRAEWERVARKQLGVDPDATIPAPAAGRAELEAQTIARLEAKIPGSSWHYLEHPIAGRVLVCVPPAESGS